MCNILLLPNKILSLLSRFEHIVTTSIIQLIKLFYVMTSKKTSLIKNILSHLLIIILLKYILITHFYIQSKMVNKFCINLINNCLLIR